MFVKTFNLKVSALLVVGLLYGIARGDISFFRPLVAQLLRLQQSNNFLIRIHAIACLKAAVEWTQTNKQTNGALSGDYPFLERHVTFAQSQSTAGNMGRNVDRLMNNVLLQNFDVTRDLTFCGIFRYLAMYTGGRAETLLPIDILEQGSKS